ncbi:hypothetical protein SDC9_149535 [bioreactor metagenome]|uniref:Uncharacterized protein n=1 Tax=bioreactor metagenome TaxID=1076179 RepID=A0A645EMG2_9ZZZZ
MKGKENNALQRVLDAEWRNNTKQKDNRAKATKHGGVTCRQESIHEQCLCQTIPLQTIPGAAHHHIGEPRVRHGIKQRNRRTAQQLAEYLSEELNKKASSGHFCPAAVKTCGCPQ